MFKKICLFVTLCTLSLSAGELVAKKSCAPTKCEPACPPKPCCNPPPPCCWNFNPCNPKGCNDMNCDNFFVTADFLYWSAENTGFTYGYSQKSALLPNFGSLLRPSSKWDPGFRLGLGWEPGYDFWDIWLNYTWYHNHSSQTKTNVAGIISLYPVESTSAFLNAHANYRLNLNMGDLEIGRLLYLTKSLAIRPIWGVRGGSLHQHFKSSFTGAVVNTNVAREFKAKNNYWGVGPRAALNGEWHLCPGFSLMSHLSGALLYGRAQTSALVQTQAAVGSPFVVNNSFKDNFNQLVPNLDFSVGIQWQTCFWCEKMFYKMGVSWETNYWWNQFNVPIAATEGNAPIPGIGNQPLSTEGLTLNFMLDF